jgi:hypothetical protein
MATPHATGTAALAPPVDPELLANPTVLKQLLMDDGKPVCATLGKTVTGKMVDAKATVLAAGGYWPPIVAACASSSPEQSTVQKHKKKH